MKELDSFTVERLEEIRNSFLDRIQESAPSIEEVFALIDIALAAKRAEPVMFRFKYPGERDYTYITHRKPDAFEMEKCEIDLLYTTPQLNSPEIPDGWIKFQEQKPIANQYISFVSRHGEYASGLVGEDEWVEMHDGTSFALDEIYIWLLLPPLPAAPEKENG